MKLCWTPLLLLIAPPLMGQTVLGVAECRETAVKNHPLQQRKDVASSINALQLENIRKNNLPRISVSGQASWQSDVVTFPFSTPSGPLLEIPKDQYRLSLDVAERLYDGGSDKVLREQRNLEAELTAIQTDVDAYQIREIVTDLFFRALYIQESTAVLKAALEDLERRLKQAEAAVAGGVTLRTTVDQVKVQILKTQQQISALEADRLSALELLGKWTRTDVTGSTLIADLSPRTSLPEGDISLRPEIKLFDVQQRQLAVGKNALLLKKQPKVELFAQGGIGRPNPFNFFETGLNSFGTVGLRAAWTPVDWGNNQREMRILDWQARNVGIQQEAFRQRYEASYLKERRDNDKWLSQLDQDDAIIALQADIVQRADAQVKNGVMTATDYLSQINLLTQARLTKKMHEIQAAQARELWVAKTGADLNR
jgi:outer membrane protein TolC